MKYRIVRQIGSGGMGVVHEAESVDGARHFAIKEFVCEGSNRGFLEKRFLAEAELLMAFDHPRIVKVHEVAVAPDTGRPHYMMDLVLNSNGERETLEDARRTGKVNEVSAAKWYEDIRSALEYCHTHGVVHRDIKLENVLIDGEGNAILSDFGVSRVFDDDLKERLGIETTFVSGETTGTKPVMGSYWYLAPEIRRGEQATEASDWYALGVLLFRLLTGMWYEADTAAFELLAPYDRSWTRLLKSLLAEDPANRRPLPVGARKSRAPLITVLTVAALAVCAAVYWFSCPEGNVFPEKTFDLGDGVKIEMIECPAGSFVMGAAESGNSRTRQFRPHEVVITRPFLLAKTHVTEEVWAKIMDWPVDEKRRGVPPVDVSVTNMRKFIARLNARFSSRLPKGYVFRFPTEAELEYATTSGGSERIDLSSPGVLGPSHEEKLRIHGKVNELSRPIKSGTKKPNRWGFYDVVGQGRTIMLDVVVPTNGMRKAFYSDDVGNPLHLTYAEKEVDPLSYDTVEVVRDLYCFLHCDSEDFWNKALLQNFTWNSLIRLCVGPDLVKERNGDVP